MSKLDQKTEVEVQKLDLSALKDLPNLHELEVSPKELSSEYWTPTEAGESKVGVILSITSENYTNEETGETVELPCITMVSQNEDLTLSTVRNGAKRLVATVEKGIEAGDIVFGQTPVKITYIGSLKNKTNQFKSDRWSVRPLIKS